MFIEYWGQFQVVQVANLYTGKLKLKYWYPKIVKAKDISDIFLKQSHSGTFFSPLYVPYKLCFLQIIK